MQLKAVKAAIYIESGTAGKRIRQHQRHTTQPELRAVENVKEVLKLTLENKNGLVQTGELTVVLDGLTVDQESLPNGTAPATKVQQNGDAIHENRGESSTGARTRSTSGASNGIECQAASTSSGQSESSAPLVNGDCTPSPSHVAARPNATLYPKPPNNHSNHSTGGSRGKICMVGPIMLITTPGRPPGRDRSHYHQAGKDVLMIEAGFTMWITTPERPLGNDPRWSL
ncbi:UNVERIFIED_CONTAM: hypothetical protein FKN15_055290 [Acipenser sinensis]